VRVVEFAFDIDDKVIVKPIEATGVVAMLGLNDSNDKTYYVAGKEKSGWWPERQLARA
jgi:hypothetical protein